eukprot:scaffold10110_cov23-Tisochrysis_lutea.AAC.2
MAWTPWQQLLCCVLALQSTLPCEGWSPTQNNLTNKNCIGAGYTSLAPWHQGHRGWHWRLGSPCHSICCKDGRRGGEMMNLWLDGVLNDWIVQNNHLPALTWHLIGVT